MKMFVSFYLIEHKILYKIAKVFLFLLTKHCTRNYVSKLPTPQSHTVEFCTMGSKKRYQMFIGDMCKYSHEISQKSMIVEQGPPDHKTWNDTASVGFRIECQDQRTATFSAIIKPLDKTDQLTLPVRNSSTVRASLCFNRRYALHF